MVDGIQTPGSLAIQRVDDDFSEIFVCNNYANTVTKHVVHRSDGMAVLHSEIAYRDGLKVPDSIAVSSSGGWIAVSNHYENAVFIYRKGSGDRPVGYLRGLGYPHGLRFLPGNDNAILVADAGAPFVHIFTTSDGSWAGTRLPSASIEVLDKPTFDRGHVNPEEGGPKGLAVSTDGKLLFATCEFEPLVIFDMEATLAGVPPQTTSVVETSSATDILSDALSAARSGLAAANASIAALSERAQDAERRAAATERQLNEVMTSRSWRITQPLRALARRLGRGR
jgi:DNA-binding beta-propeller fold protein YncE